jgi:hypothetical protein
MRMVIPFPVEKRTKLLSPKFGWRLILLWPFDETNAAAMRAPKCSARWRSREKGRYASTVPRMIKLTWIDREARDHALQVAHPDEERREASTARRFPVARLPHSSSSIEASLAMT